MSNFYRVTHIHFIYNVLHLIYNVCTLITILRTIVYRSDDVFTTYLRCKYTLKISPLFVRKVSSTNSLSSERFPVLTLFKHIVRILLLTSLPVCGVLFPLTEFPLFLFLFIFLFLRWALRAHIFIFQHTPAGRLIEVHD